MMQNQTLIYCKARYLRTLEVLAVSWNYRDSLRDECCRPVKGDEMLEQYEGKLSRTVLRREGEIAPSLSFDIGV